MAVLDKKDNRVRSRVDPVRITRIAKTTHMACKRPFSSSIKLAVTRCFCAVLMSGCVGGVVGGGPVLERLNGRGPVMLASDNPYLPANRLLEDEMKASNAMREFVDRRGRPTAIGVTRGILKRPEIQLYYPDAGEVYSFKHKGGDWLTRGPEEISSADREVLALNETSAQDLSVQKPGSGSTDLEERMIAHLEQEPDSSARASMRPLPHIRYASLKRLPKGSYSHTVTFSGETLAVLADWYTGNRAYASRLRASVRSAANAPLKKGVTVTIPKELLRNKTPLPETALR